ncbi:hypothetical protein CFC21_025802 [Triticum aestivum]|uniref:DC1 domain-containing protein n=2 Tax=Triticum aestivum TaxID=4565 RepID=A0A3B6CE45_WHEAT|nr:uncharacterized protein LOC123042299 [Triticum aestivum]KAF7011505.1 hypothetical protein CFC21_025802 [Triticum aestivum]
MTRLPTPGQPLPPSKEISRRDHSNLGHQLTREPTGQAKFKCNGCLEEVTGCDRDTCKPCDFDLHQACNLQEGTMLVHPLLPESRFVLRLEAPSSKQRCSACGTRTQGTHYRCERTGHYLHPCCAMLPMEIKLSDELSFELREKGSRRCAKCREGGGVRDYWFYCSTSTSKKVHLHVACAREYFLLPSSSSTTDMETASGKHGSRKAGRNSDPFFEIVKNLATIIIAVLTGNPVALIPAVIDLGSNDYKSLKKGS